MKCSICANYLTGIEKCKFCSFEYDERYTTDDWDIFNLPDDEFEHIQIRNRLWGKGIECLCADNWYNDDMAIIYGCGSNATKIADALNIHRKIVYIDEYHDIAILNLFEEKHIRSLENVTCKGCKYFRKGALNTCDFKNKVVGYEQSACEFYEED